MRLRDLERRIEELERSARSFSDASGVPARLAALENVEIRDAALLARFHDALLFVCAYPATPQIRRSAESQLKGFARRVAALERAGDITPLLDPEVSGIAGTSVDVIFSYDFVRWLARRFPGQLAIDWDDDSTPESRPTVFARLLPFLREETSVDAHVPYGVWLAAADRGLESLLAELDAPAYDGLQLWIRWMLRDSPMTRTRLRRPVRAIDYQTSPLLSRREVSIERELSSEPLRVTRLSKKEGEAVLDIARAAIAMRYRELYCFTFGDPAAVFSADCGRGLEIVLIGTLPSKRLPLRAGFGAFFFRNGVPVGYADALGLGERMEVSFNIFYAFRNGESAFCFARLLKLYHQLFGSTSFSIDPYQIGLDNEEAIEAGAFWFYRKLGFRASDPAVEQIARREEQRIAQEPDYRTPARTLRRIARSSLAWGANTDWDRFHVRNIGLTIQKKFAASGESATAFAESCRKRVAAKLGISRRAAGDLALVLDLVALERWSAEERAAVRAITLAKQGRSEKEYLRLLGRHDKLRRAIIAAGSQRRSATSR